MSQFLKGHLVHDNEGDQVFGGEDEDSFLAAELEEFWTGITGGIDSIQPGDAAGLPIEGCAGFTRVEDHQLVPD